tara:strand:- start:218 stop:445 length:228 start_codon:yes stop_codon:yes gene_type:complete
MPFYKFKNKKTGHTFEKLLTFEEHDRYLENKNLVQIPVPFKVANLISNSENKMREQIWDMAQAGKKQSNWKDNRG